MKYVILNAAGDFEEKWLEELKFYFKIKKHEIVVDPRERYHKPYKEVVYVITINKLTDFEQIIYVTNEDLIIRQNLRDLHPQVQGYLCMRGINQKIEIYDYYVE